jgi:hypothetical protein
MLCRAVCSAPEARQVPNNLIIHMISNLALLECDECGWQGRSVSTGTSHLRVCVVRLMRTAVYPCYFFPSWVLLACAYACVCHL